jgi:hypothetical protein
VLPFKHFHAGAIAIALAEHGAGRPQPVTRAIVSEAKHVAPSSSQRWLCLQRWAAVAALGKLFVFLAPVAMPATYREVAARVALALEGRGRQQPGESPIAALWRGAMAA